MMWTVAQSQGHLGWARNGCPQTLTALGPGMARQTAPHSPSRASLNSGAVTTLCLEAHYCLPIGAPVGSAMPKDSPRGLRCPFTLYS